MSIFLICMCVVRDDEIDLSFIDCRVFISFLYDVDFWVTRT
jgi:hypothetical protein